MNDSNSVDLHKLFEIVKTVYFSANPDKEYVTWKSNLFMELCVDSANEGKVTIPVVKQVAYEMLDESLESQLLQKLE